MILDDLCHVCEVVTLPNGRKIRVRAMSDVDRRECELEAMSIAARLVKLLRDDASREYQAILLPQIQGGLERIKSSLAAYRDLSAVREAAREILPEYIPFPDNAQDDEKRDVLLKRTEHLKSINERRIALRKQKVEEFKKSLEAMDEESLTKLFHKNAADGVADSVYMDEYVRYLLYLTCEIEDGTKRFFKSVDEVRSLNPAVRDFLYGEYLKVDSADPFLLQSPSAMESSTA